MSFDNLALLVHKSVNKFPNKCAIQFVDENVEIFVNYSDIESYAEIVSQFLSSFKSSKLFKNNYFVGVCLGVTYTYPCIIYGILKAGFAFVPLDPMNGILWNKDIINRLKIKLIFTNINERCKFLEDDIVIHKIQIIKEIVELLCTNVTDEISLCPVAYSVQTSGTTGIPKIIKVPHLSIIPNILDLSSLFEVKSDDVIFLSSPPTFDPSVIEIFLALCNGATLLIVDESMKKHPKYLLDVLFPHSCGRVTILQVTPSTFQNWLIDASHISMFSKSSKLRLIAFGGERFPSLRIIKEWNLPTNVQIYNLYGISEVSCWAAITKLPLTVVNEEVDKMTSDCQFSNLTESINSCESFSESMSETILQVRDLDENNIGEMFIGSNKRICFIDDEDPKIYNYGPVFRPSGDLFWKNGDKYHFIGRKKNDIKRFGVRLNLKSVEAVAEFDLSVKQAVCQYHQNEDGSCLLGLYIVPHSHFSMSTFKNSFKERCPQGAWPDVIHMLSSIPVTRHGKIDEKILFKLILQGRQQLRDVKELFSCLWLNYSVEIEIVSDKGFISSGGTSFSAVQLVAEMQRLTDVKYDFLTTLIEDVEFDKCLDKLRQVKMKSLENNDSLSEHINDIRKLNKKIKLDQDTSVLSEDIVNYQEKLNENYSKLYIKIKWKYNLGKCVDASPACEVIEDKNYIVTGSHSGRVAVLETQSGKVTTEIVLPDRIESMACIDQIHKCFSIGCYNGYIYTYSLSGDLLWSFKTGDMVKSNPVIVESNIVCGSYDKYVYCLNRINGHLLWKQNVEGQVLTRVQLCGALIIVVTLAGTVTALQAEDGKRVWTVNIGCPIFANFLIYDRRCIIASVEGTLHWISIDKMEQVLDFKADGNIFCSLVQHEDCVLFGTTKGWLYRLSINNAILFWKVQLGSRLVSAPLIITSNVFSDKLLGISMFEHNNKSVILIASSKGYVYLLHYETGSIINSLSLPGEIFSSPALNSNLVIIGCRDNHIYCLEVNVN